MSTSIDAGAELMQSRSQCVMFLAMSTLYHSFPTGPSAQTAASNGALPDLVLSSCGDFRRFYQKALEGCSVLL